MKHLTMLLIALAFLASCSASKSRESKATATASVSEAPPNPENMKVGAFSMSLSVKDLKVSKEFYENLGFTVKGGGMEQNYLIMKNGNALIGIFQGMFDNNILTFNPGWDESGNNVAQFEDVREIQKLLKAKGVKIDAEVDETTSGPGFIMLTDPDGNAILFDQHR
jgi:predicted enzyme related to lactoylglutathione lyase